MEGNTDIMAKYTLIVSAGENPVKIESDSWKALQALPGALGCERSNSDDTAIEEALKAYYKTFKRRVHPRIEGANIDRDVIRLYLRGLALKEVKLVILKRKKVKLSLSCLGRYWKRLREAGILPSISR